MLTVSAPFEEPRLYGTPTWMVSSHHPTQNSPQSRFYNSQTFFSLFFYYVSYTPHIPMQRDDYSSASIPLSLKMRGYRIINGTGKFGTVYIHSGPLSMPVYPVVRLMDTLYAFSSFLHHPLRRSRDHTFQRIVLQSSLVCTFLILLMGSGKACGILSCGRYVYVWVHLRMFFRW